MSATVAGEGVQPGGFRASTPGFDTRRLFNVGAVVSVAAPDGEFLLSNSVQARPLSNIDIQPTAPKFYVQTGTGFPGRVVDFTQSSRDAALVDSTDGRDNCEVSLSWSGWRIDYW